MTRNGPEPADDGADALRRLLTRLATPLDTYDGDAPPARVHVGRLPGDLPVEVPLPEGSTVLGSVERGLPRGRRTVEILLDVAPPAERAREDYRRKLLNAGWDEDTSSPGRSGFNPRGLPLAFRAAYRFPRLRRRMGLDRQEIPPLFRLGSRGPKLTVLTQDHGDDPTDVRLRLILNHRDPWLHHDAAWNAIPTLYYPPGTRDRPEIENIGVLWQPPDARELGGGGGREPDGAHSYVILKTDLDLASLASYYSAQLEAAGWRRVDEGLDGPQAWSAWTFTHEGAPWSGAFSALRLFGTEGRHLLQVYAARTPNATRTTGRA